MLLAETREHLQHVMSEFERAWDSMEMKITVRKRKCYWLKRTREGVVRRGGNARDGQV